MANFLYQRATDNVAPSATVAVNTGTGDPDYLPANLVDLNPAKPAQLTTTTGSWTFNFASPQQVDVLSIIMHNLTAGLEVRLQGHTSNSWGSPTLNLTITIPTYRTDGFPINPWLDVAAQVPVAASRTFAWWRLVIVGTNGAAVKIGEVWLGATKRHLTRNIKWGRKNREQRPGVIHETDYLVKLKYDFGVLRRSIAIEIENNATSLDEILAWGQSCRWTFKPTLIVPNPDNGSTDRLGPMMVNFVTTEAEYETQRAAGGLFPMSLAFEEMSRGLVL